jgi:two-component system, NarL family, sensor histidine kinase DevS
LRTVCYRPDMSGTIDTSERARQTGTTGLVEAFDAATRAIAGLQSVDDVLQVIVDEVRPLVGARYAALGIVGQDGVIERFITSGISQEQRARIGSLPRGHGFLGMIIRENRSIRIPDIATDDRRHGFPPHHPPMHSFLGVPVTVHGASIGNLYLTDKLDAVEFSEVDQRLVETFALHAGIAIENAQLHEQAERLAVVDERERIGKDLHDSIIQSLYAVGLSLEDVPELVRGDPDQVEQLVERAIDSIHLTIQDIRNFIFGLRPELLSGTSLATGLVAIAEEFRHNSMIDLEVDLAGVGEPGPDATGHLLGIANEALSNIARHSGATRAVVAVGTAEDGNLRLRIIDNGRGFDASTVPTGFGHHGLANMHSRAESIGATMDVDSGPNGTTIDIRLRGPGPAPAGAPST